MRGMASLPVMLVAGASLAWAQLPGARPDTLQVVPAGGKPPRTVVAWNADGAVYLPGEVLAQVMGGTYSWVSELGKFTLTVGGHTAEFVDQSEVAVIDRGDVLPLKAPCRLWEGRMLVPLDAVVDDRGEAHSWIDAPLHFDAGAGVLQAGENMQPHLIDIQVNQDALGWKLSFIADRPFKTQLLRAERASMILRLTDVSYDPHSVQFPEQHPWFQGLRLRSTPRGLEVVFSAGVLPRGYRLIQSHDAQTAEVLLGVDERDIRTGRLTPFTAPSGGDRMRLRRLVLDPGHDGADPGGALAYDLCRSLARELTASLDLEVVITHDRDRDPPPETRVRRANESSGDLFISLHVHDRPRGPTVYVGRPAVPLPVNHDLSRLGFRPYYSGQDGYVQVSRAVAQDLLQAVADALEEAPGGVFTVSLPELQGALMPAILLEIGRGRRAWDEDERSRVVDAVARAVRQHYWRTGP